MAKVTSPDQTTVNQIYFAGTVEGAAGSAPTWQRGLPLMTETFGRSDANSQVTRQRSSATLWEQAGTNPSYSLNPRAYETNVYDYNALGVIQNRKRTQVTYKSVTFANNVTCSLPEEIYEYQANATTILRRTHTDYMWDLDTTYTDRHIIGLVRKKELYEVNPATQIEKLMSRVGFGYDESVIQGTEPVQHDSNYNSSFVAGRGNLTSVKRFDVLSATEVFLSSTLFYNTSGSVVKSVDPANHQTLFTYADQFAANGLTLDAARPATLAYPTQVTDPDGYTASSRYHYDFGAVTWTQTPLPNTTQNLPGPQQTVNYDSFGRIQRSTNLVNGAYTRYVYPGTQPGSQNRIDTFATITDGASEQNGNEAHSFQIADGHGRVIATASSHPGTDGGGGFSGQRIIYDVMGRVFKTSNPTETNDSGPSSQWAAVGDDAPTGWLYTKQTYDWKGRPLVTTHPDTKTKEANYTGCGCAGGEVVTLTDEGTLVDIDPSAGVNYVTRKRQQKIYSDSLGRTVKTEILNWDGPGSFGTGGTVYSTIVSTFNGRDQVSLMREFNGAAPSDPNDLSCPSGTCQQTKTTYDGYGRLRSNRVPEQDANTETTYDYNPDDTVKTVKDARGATQKFFYENKRRLVTRINYTAPAEITAAPSASFDYDSVGNRTSGSDGSGTTTSEFNQLSQIFRETHTFTYQSFCWNRQISKVGGVPNRCRVATAQTCRWLRPW